jgi:hypothetical protein
MRQLIALVALAFVLAVGTAAVLTVHLHPQPVLAANCSSDNC